MRRLFLASSALLALASCSTPEVAPAPAPPAPLPAPTPAPAPRPAPTPALGADWRDWPLTPGTWAYRQDGRGSIALFGRAGTDADLTLRCDRGRGQLYLSRAGEGFATLTVRTSTDRKAIPVTSTGGVPPYMAAELTPRDSLVDSMGFSRGRFVVQASGMPDLVLPAWPEILRVAEDCR
ncbi:MAG: hypothetical protein KF730_02400 [Sphingomonas sp.]|uniref:hypothetical protein n=1 Tax=Sphingomonas sp. TaxID=28214 RepID=UPI0025DDF0B3|nr:hypothetical protein [Sphingomonas sp.]MBX3563406.1 hypothetical protein [Sphingomonas sp.]